MSALHDASVFGVPEVDPSVYIGQGTTLVGDVTIGRQSSVWYNCVLRGDVQKITIGMRTNIQDGTVIHGTTNGLPVIIGDDVTVGHGAILHACTVENMGFVGFGARVLDHFDGVRTIWRSSACHYLYAFTGLNCSGKILACADFAN